MNVLHLRWLSLINPACALLLAPLLLGLIRRVKYRCLGRSGPPLLQPYFDLARLLQKQACVSRTASVLFFLGPTAGLAALVLVQFMLPLGSHPGFVSFGGDFIFFVYLLGLARFCTILSSLDTGSWFAGLGAARESFFSLLAEPALLLSLAAVAHVAHTQVAIAEHPPITHANDDTSHAIANQAVLPPVQAEVPPAFDVSMSHIHALLSFETWRSHGVVLALVASSFFLVLLCENSRLPVSDPESREELAMIHEALLLEHSGPDLAMLAYADALKLWALASLLLGMVTPPYKSLVIDLPSALAAMFALGILIGVLEAMLVRWRLTRVPRLLLTAASLAAVALVLEYGYGG